MKKILRFFKLKKDFFLLNRICYAMRNCSTCPFTKTKSTDGCIVCQTRAKIDHELEEYAIFKGDEDDW